MTKNRNKTILQPYIFGLIQAEISRVKESNRAPVVATKRALMDTICRDIDEALETLKSEDLIIEQLNVNRMPMYQIKERK